MERENDLFSSGEKNKMERENDYFSKIDLFHIDDFSLVTAIHWHLKWILFILSDNKRCFELVSITCNNWKRVKAYCA